jgi:hypothetical protein
VGELRRDLIACLRHAYNKRLPRSKGEDRRGQILDMLSVHVRPPETEDCQFSKRSACAVNLQRQAQQRCPADMPKQFNAKQNRKLKANATTLKPQHHLFTQ